MKIAITVLGAGLGAWLDQNFGDCKQVMLIDKDNHFEAWENPHQCSGDASDALVAQHIIMSEADVLITGHLSTDLISRFLQANINVMEVESGNVLDLIESAREVYQS